MGTGSVSSPAGIIMHLYARIESSLNRLHAFIMRRKASGLDNPTNAPLMNKVILERSYFSVSFSLSRRCVAARSDRPGSSFLVFFGRRWVDLMCSYLCFRLSAGGILGTVEVRKTVGEGRGLCSHGGFFCPANRCKEVYV